MGEAAPVSPSPIPQNRRRRTAPARGPSAVYALCRRNRNETKRPSPLLMGLGCVNPSRRHCPAALPPPCSWAVRRVCALSPKQKRNEAPKPPARGAWARESEPKALAGGTAAPPAHGAWVRESEPKALAGGTAAPPARGAWARESEPTALAGDTVALPASTCRPCRRRRRGWQPVPARECP